MRVLITGGAGFIGSNLADLLLASGHDVGVVDNLSTGKRDNLDPDVWFKEIDILDPALPEVVTEFSPTAIVHLAAQASVTASIADPERDWLVNAEGTRLVAELAAGLHVRRVISASSAAVYGEPLSIPISETAGKSPVNPYGKSKLAAEELLAEELAPEGVDFASFRFSNVYGPRQDAEGEGGVVAVFCDTVARGGVPTIYGSGDQTRDFIFVGDVASAIVVGLESTARLRDGRGRGPAYNISTGVETTVSELAGIIRDISEEVRLFDHAPSREGDVDRSALDPSKARDVFAWDARMSLPAGIESTWEWFVERAKD